MEQIVEGSEFESETEEEESDYINSNSQSDHKVRDNKHYMTKSNEIIKKNNETLLKDHFDNRIRQVKQENYLMSLNFKKRSLSKDES